MKSRGNYLINEHTVCIEGRNDEQNQPYSCVIEGDQSFVVNMSPVEIIDYSLQYYCSSLKGACEGSKSVLGNISMLPLVIYAPLDLYWFPCFSPYRSDCTWFALRNIRNYEALDQKTTIVHMKYGHTICLAMKRDRFERKWQRATHLRYITEARIEKASTINFE
ncbi:competence protein ComK [Bacillus marasmi]|uniref:competence protein ComK n=1 Tax=Bacillus marasmi TaxID=1926279 RepID=UPI00164E3AFA|nr:competence protein ComK [Bacillus marasmi]